MVVVHLLDEVDIAFLRGLRNFSELRFSVKETPHSLLEQGSVSLQSCHLLCARLRKGSSGLELLREKPDTQSTLGRKLWDRVGLGWRAPFAASQRSIAFWLVFIANHA